MATRHPLEPVSTTVHTTVSPTLYGNSSGAIGPDLCNDFQSLPYVLGRAVRPLWPFLCGRLPFDRLLLFLLKLPTNSSCKEVEVELSVFLEAKR